MSWIASEPIRIIVPGSPKPLERNRHRIMNRKGSGAPFVVSYMPAQSAANQSSIRKFASDAMNGRPPLDGAVDLRVVAYMPVPESWSKRKQTAALADQMRPTGRPDADNILKGICDSIQDIVVRNDTIFTETSIWKRFALNPRLVIECRLLTWTD